MTRIFLSTGNIVLSLILGALLFGFVFLKYPDTMATILEWASSFKSWLISRGLATEYNNWIRVLLEERQLVFMDDILSASRGRGLLDSRTSGSG